MNRRDLFGAFLSGLIAALVLPFEDFVRWWRGVASSRRNVETLLNAAHIANFEVGMPISYEGFGGRMGTVTITGIDRDRGIITVSA